MSSEQSDLELESYQIDNTSEIVLKPSYENFIPQRITTTQSILKIPQKLSENCRTCTAQLISKIDWDEIENHDNLVVCNLKYLAYVVKSYVNGTRVVKVRFRNPLFNCQTIIKDVDSDIVSMEFMSPYDNILGLVDSNGTVYVVKIFKRDNDSSSKLLSMILCKFVIPKHDEFSFFCNSIYKITWLPWKYRLNFENKLLPKHNNKQMLLIYGDNGCCIVYNFKIDLVDSKLTLVDNSQDLLVQSLYLKNLHNEVITSAYISPDGDYISTSSIDGKFAIWKIEFTMPYQILRNISPKCELIPFIDSDPIIMHHWCDTRILSHDKITYWSVFIVMSCNNIIKLYNSSDMSLVQTISLQSLTESNTNKNLVLHSLVQSFGSKFILYSNNNCLLIFNITMKVTPDTTITNTNEWLFTCPFISEVYTMPLNFDVLDLILYPEVYINKSLVGNSTFNSEKSKMLRIFLLDRKSLYSVEFFLHNSSDDKSIGQLVFPYWMSSSYSSMKKVVDEFDISKYDISKNLVQIEEDFKSTKPINNNYPDKEMDEITTKDDYNKDSSKPILHMNNNNQVFNSMENNLTTNNSELYHTALTDFSITQCKDYNNESKFHDTLSNFDPSTPKNINSNFTFPFAVDDYPHNLFSDMSTNGVSEYSKYDTTSGISFHQTKITDNNIFEFENTPASQQHFSHQFDDKFKQLESMLNIRFGKLEQNISSLKSKPQCQCSQKNFEITSQSSTKKITGTDPINNTIINQRFDTLETLLTKIVTSHTTSTETIVARISENVKNIIGSHINKLENKLTDAVYSNVEKLCQRMFIDIDKTFRNGTKEYLNYLQHHLNQHEKKFLKYKDNESIDNINVSYNDPLMESICNEIGQIELKTKEIMQTNLNCFKKDILEHLVSTIQDLNYQQTDLIADIVEWSVGDKNSSLISKDNPRANITKLLNQRVDNPLNDARHLLENGEVVKALSIALQNDYKEFCLELCISHEPSIFFKDPHLTVPITELYKLVKILSEDLTTNQHQKISYLQEILLLFDVAEYRHDVDFIECIQILLNRFDMYKSNFDKPTLQIVRMLTIICKRYLR